MVTWIGLERTGLPRVDSESVADSGPSACIQAFAWALPSAWSPFRAYSLMLLA